ncbi:MAG: lysine transporter LysE [Polaromonas sp.]|nr:lysine transporter LysE [Polaromonas sp.]
MTDVQNLGLFILAGWLLNLTPGPDVLCIVNTALRDGARAGMVAALGITAGCFVHVAAAALGVGVLMTTSTAAFLVLKWVGALYLFYVGLKLLLQRGSAIEFDVANKSITASDRGQKSLKNVFFKGFLTNALNPKVALFFLAFVPQFIAPGAQHPALAFVALGVLFNLNALPINLGYAWLAARATRRLGLVQRGVAHLDRLAGVMFVGFGVRLALSEAPGR